MQPLVLYPDSGDLRPRFRANAVVRRLINEHGISLSTIANWEGIPIDDQEQFWQQTGYSADGFAELSFVRPETLLEVDKRVLALGDSKDNPLPVFPMQPIYLDENKVARFKRNAIIDRLFQERLFDLNSIGYAVATRAVPIEDAEQFWQQLGYSVSGYGDLSFVRPSTRAEASRQVDLLMGRDPGPPWSPPKGWETLDGREVQNTEEDGDDVRLYLTDGSILLAQNAKNVTFVVERESLDKSPPSVQDDACGGA